MITTNPACKWKIPRCNPLAHQKAIREFSTGQKLSMCVWWGTVPRLHATSDNCSVGPILASSSSDINSGQNFAQTSRLKRSKPSEKAGEIVMMSWRALDAPLFTIMNRGREVDSLTYNYPNCEECCTPPPDFVEESRTIMFSHHDEQCYVAQQCIQLERGDPPIIVQFITDIEVQPGADSQKEVSCLKMVDVILASPEHPDGVGVCPSKRVEVMKRISEKWAWVSQNQIIEKQIIEKQNENQVEKVTTKSENRCWKLDSANSQKGRYTDRRGAMWYGLVTSESIKQVCDLRRTLRHTMECLIILTEDPHMQIHIPMQKLFMGNSLMESSLIKNSLNKNRLINNRLIQNRPIKNLHPSHNNNNFEPVSATGRKRQCLSDEENDKTRKRGVLISSFSACAASVCFRASMRTCA